MLYSMLAGHPPFRGENDRLLVNAILFLRPEPLRSVRPEVPAELERLVARMLAKDPAERPESMAEVRAGLGVSGISQEIPRERTAPHRVHRTPWARRWAAGAAAATLIAGLAAFALRPVPGHRSPPSASIAGRVARPSIAVLPFENLSRDPAQDYLAEGLTEALTTDLAKISGLKVVSRTSAEHYKTTAKALPEIASELGVDNVLEGSVLKANRASPVRGRSGSAGRGVPLRVALVGGGTTIRLTFPRAEPADSPATRVQSSDGSKLDS